MFDFTLKEIKIDFKHVELILTPQLKKGHVTKRWEPDSGETPQKPYKGCPRVRGHSPKKEIILGWQSVLKQQQLRKQTPWP